MVVPATEYSFRSRSGTSCAEMTIVDMFVSGRMRDGSTECPEEGRGSARRHG
ncbi:hypothetical protein C7S14_8498 [Burkholderia cepacia]|nr:hypothetical protein C7S14_8498 [Burkholderia cepacia]